jgi:hypothetical protein
MDYLSEKLPIILHEQIVSVDELIKTAFRFLYVFKSSSKPALNLWQTNRAKYCLLVAKNNSSIKISHPRYSKSSSPPFVEMPLTKHTPLILPAWWRYQVNDESFDKHELHDLLSPIVGILK